MTQNSEITCLADRLVETEDLIRDFELLRDDCRAQLACALRAAEQDTVISTSGKTYKLSRPPARYTFHVPPEEMQRLGILCECTPPPEPPKLTKTKLDDLLKKHRLEDTDVAEWQQKGWYVIERSDEITVKQVETRLGTLKQSVGIGF